ncbi:CATRA system-associated protein [Streptomyces sp. NPDC058257]|uniref:CATRA system-associated protein n=1 Tax=Streptomyces sp. NPDC058257 TaxID=3346409 RepID=UPI0036E5AD0C
MNPQKIIERLREIEGWQQLSAEEWRTVGDVLDRLGAALPEGDDTEIRSALAPLEPLERKEARRARAELGAKGIAIPPQQRERRNHLIERLTADLRSPEDRGPGVPGGREARGTSE